MNNTSLHAGDAASWVRCGEAGGTDEGGSTGLQRVEVAVKVQRVVGEVERDLVEVVVAGGACDVVEHGRVADGVDVDGEHSHRRPHHALAVIEQLARLVIQREGRPALTRCKLQGTDSRTAPPGNTAGCFLYSFYVLAASDISMCMPAPVRQTGAPPPDEHGCSR